MPDSFDRLNLVEWGRSWSLFAREAPTLNLDWLSPMCKSASTTQSRQRLRKSCSLLQRLALDLVVSCSPNDGRNAHQEHGPGREAAREGETKRGKLPRRCSTKYTDLMRRPSGRQLLFVLSCTLLSRSLSRPASLAGPCLRSLDSTRCERVSRELDAFGAGMAHLMRL